MAGKSTGIRSQNISPELTGLLQHFFVSAHTAWVFCQAIKEKPVRLMVKSEARMNHLLVNTFCMMVGLEWWDEGRKRDVTGVVKKDWVNPFGWFLVKPM